MTGPLPDLTSLTQLRYLRLGQQWFSGGIPPWLGSMQTLEYLDLTSNQFGGPIPASLGNLTNLATLALGSCGLSGPIPQSLSALAKLESFGISSNFDLDGTIPPIFDNMPRLRFFVAYQNKFVGGIPDMSKLTALNWLQLGYNMLNSTIPSYFATLGPFQWLTLSDNSFTGPIPEGLVNRVTQRLELFNNQFTGCLTNNASAPYSPTFCDASANPGLCSCSGSFCNAVPCPPAVAPVAPPADPPTDPPAQPPTQPPEAVPVEPPAQPPIASPDEPPTDAPIDPPVAEPEFFEPPISEPISPPELAPISVLPPENDSNVLKITTPTFFPGRLLLNSSSVVNITSKVLFSAPMLTVGGCVALGGTLLVDLPLPPTPTQFLVLAFNSGHCDGIIRTFHTIRTSLDSANCARTASVRTFYESRSLTLAFGPYEDHCAPL